MQKTIDAIVATLVGSNETLEHGFAVNDAEHLINNDEALDKIDEEIFCCSVCGWWSFTSEMLDDWNCCA